MLDSAWQRVDGGIRSAIPFVTTLFCVVAGVVAWPLPYIGTVTPPLALMTLYYWAVHRPDLLGPGTAFVMGLLHDILNGLPPGLCALLFVAAHQLIFRNRRFFAGHSFLVLWAGFGLAVVSVTVVEWVLLAILSEHIPPILSVFTQTLLAGCLFPLMAWALMRIQRLTVMPV